MAGGAKAALERESKARHRGGALEVRVAEAP